MPGGVALGSNNCAAASSLNEKFARPTLMTMEYNVLVHLLDTNVYALYSLRQCVVS